MKQYKWNTEVVSAEIPESTGLRTLSLMLLTSTYGSFQGRVEVSPTRKAQSQASGCSALDVLAQIKEGAYEMSPSSRGTFMTHSQDRVHLNETAASTGSSFEA